MVTLQLSLPDHIKAAAEAQAAGAGWNSIDDYIASLIKADELPAMGTQLEDELIRGLDSGPAVQITPELISDIRHKSRT